MRLTSDYAERERRTREERLRRLARAARATDGRIARKRGTVAGIVGRIRARRVER